MSVSARRRNPLVVLLLLTAGLGVPACSSSAVGPEIDIEGRWIWVKSEGGLLPADRTPESEGYGLTLVFGSTGTVRLLQDGTLVGETTYEVTVGAPTGALEGAPVIRYGEPLLGFQEQAYQFVTRHTLLLADGCCDGFTYHFLREEAS